MRVIFYFFFFVCCIPFFSYGQYQQWEWAKSFGGSGTDSSVDMKIKNGHLYVTGNFTSSQINWDNTIFNNNGGKDIFVAKLDTNGNTIWVKNFGGNGDDLAYQIEINNTGVSVIRCTSTSSNISIGAVNLMNPQNFYLELDADGNLLNGKALPDSLIFNDIDIDHDGGIYTAATFSSPFVIGNELIDTSIGGKGTCVIKYDNSAAYQWVKSVKLEEETAYGPNYRIAATIEYNNSDSAITIVWGFSWFGRYTLVGFGNNASAGIGSPGDGFVYAKLDNNGMDKLISISSGGGGSFASHVMSFETGNSGLDYMQSARQGLVGIFNSVIRWYSRSRVKSIEFYISMDSVDLNAPFQYGSLEPSEDGNYVLANGSWYQNFIEVLDSNLNRIIK